MELVILSGLSGAGKSTGVKVLEDIGFFCVDNMPASLVKTFVELCKQNERVNKVALVIDARGSDFFDTLGDALKYLKSEKIGCRILFFEATDDVLEHRFKETRRIHPLMSEGVGMREAIAKERELLTPLRRRADIIIDSTQFKTSQLRERMTTMFLGSSGKGMKVHVMSFGFKNGLPTDADIVMDVRYLPNPYYVDELRPLTGLDKPIVDYVMDKPETKEFIKRFKSLLEYIVPLNCKEGKSSLMIAVGCTGGQHRSVALTEEFGRYIRELGYDVTTGHRDIRKS